MKSSVQSIFTVYEFNNNGQKLMIKIFSIRKLSIQQFLKLVNNSHMIKGLRLLITFNCVKEFLPYIFDVF